MFKFEQTALTSDVVSSENWKAKNSKAEKKLQKVNDNMCVIPTRSNVFNAESSGQTFTIFNQCGLNSILSGLMHCEAKNQFLSVLAVKPDIISITLKVLNETDHDSANQEVLNFILNNVVYKEMDNNSINSKMTTASLLKRILPESIKMTCSNCSKEKVEQ